MWDGSLDGARHIPYELSDQFRGFFLEYIKNAIAEINDNLKNCIQFTCLDDISRKMYR